MRRRRTDERQSRRQHVAHLHPGGRIRAVVRHRDREGHRLAQQRRRPVNGCDHLHIGLPAIDGDPAGVVGGIRVPFRLRRLGGAIGERPARLTVARSVSVVCVPAASAPRAHTPVAGV